VTEISLSQSHGRRLEGTSSGSVNFLPVREGFEGFSEKGGGWCRLLFLITCLLVSAGGERPPFLLSATNCFSFNEKQPVSIPIKVIDKFLITPRLAQLPAGNYREHNILVLKLGHKFVQYSISNLRHTRA